MPILELREVTKKFRGTTALDRVSLEIEAGEVVALVGENGAGKSTLAKILAGVLVPDAGGVVVDGAPVRLATPMKAFAHGIGAVHEGPHLLPQLSVSENLLLGREPRRLGFIDERGARAEGARVVADLELHLDPRARVSELSEAEARMVELARVFSRGCRVTVLDEPTEPLGPSGRAWLSLQVRALRSAGRSALYVSHRLDEALALSDRLVVLRGGRKVAEHRSADVTAVALEGLLAGRPPEAAAPWSERQPGENPARREGALAPRRVRGGDFHAASG